MKVTRSIQLLITALLIAAAMQLHAQAPQGINYQSVARNSLGVILINQNISLRLTIHDSTSTGTSVYVEHQTVQTNAFGTFSVVIGGGSIILGNFSNINWGTNGKYLQVEMDFAGGTNYTNMGVSQLLSVPYALYANNSGGNITNLKYDTTGILNISIANNTTISPTKNVWIVGGNSGLSTANNFIGTIDNTDMIIKRGGKEGMRYAAGGALLATGDTTIGVTPTSGAGRRMMWIPAKGAFRAGTVTGTQWDDINIGSNSTAIGYNSMASGSGAIAIGTSAKAIGTNSMAIGNGVISKTTNAFVFGTYNDTTSTTSLSSSDVLFQVGNGSSSARSNAFTVSKSGQVLATQLISQSMTLTDTLITVGTSFSIPVNYSFIIITSTVSPSNAVMTLQSGSRIGQMVVIEVLGPGGGNSNGVRMIDGSTYGLNIPSAGADMHGGDMVTLVWDGTTWTQTSISINH